MQFGSALGDIAPEDKIVTIPGISGREPKEISFKSLAYIIQSRMEEIIDYVAFEIENSGYADKLSAGIVLTGGGALLRHLSQLVKFKTGYDVRIGYPNEHLTAETDEDINSPTYSTAIGLVLKGFEQLETCKKINAENQKDNDTDEEIEIAPKDIKRNNLLDRFKRKFTEIFEENDTVM